MKEIISKKTRHIQIVDPEVWENIVARGWANRYTVTEIVERKLSSVPLIQKPEEIKTHTKKRI